MSVTSQGLIALGLFVGIPTLLLWALRKRLWGFGAQLEAGWQERQRQLDITYLWPHCKANAPNLAAAHYAFAAHALCDPAWQALSDDEWRERVMKLE